MPVVLMPLSSHIFLQLWAAYLMMQNVLLYVCVCICTCLKLEMSMLGTDATQWLTCQNYHGTVLSIITMQLGCNLYWSLLYTFTLYNNIQQATSNIRTESAVTCERYDRYFKNSLMTINLWCIVLILACFIFRTMMRIWWIYETSYVYVVLCYVLEFLQKPQYGVIFSSSTHLHTTVMHCARKS